MPATVTSPIASLRGLVGDERVREGSAADAVDGMRPAAVVEPVSVDEASSVLAFCSANGLAVIPRGAGTKLSWGGPPDRVDVLLSTAQMDAVLDHAAGDLVVVAQAGCGIEALQATLARSGQMLALDPPHGGATLGGIVASGASGPRRLRYGTPRDLLIGITVVLSDGTVARAGGRVVKNVAGYDLGRLFTGSFGTLGLIAEVTFRLHPIPAHSQSVDCAVETPEAAFAAVRLAVSPPLDPVAVELSWPSASGAGSVEAWFEGTEPGVQAQTRRLVSLLGHPATRGIGAPSAGPTVPETPGASRQTRIKVTHPPAVLSAAIRAAWNGAAGAGGSPAVSGHAATGVTYVDIGAIPPQGVAAMVRALRGFAAGVGGSAVLQDGPPEAKAGLDPWGPVGDALGLMRRVKERFDPTRTMSPGRFVGRI